MNQKEKLLEATMLALQGKLTESDDDYSKLKQINQSFKTQIEDKLPMSRNNFKQACKQILSSFGINISNTNFTNSSAGEVYTDNFVISNNLVDGNNNNLEFYFYGVGNANNDASDKLITSAYFDISDVGRLDQNNIYLNCKNILDSKDIDTSTSLSEIEEFKQLYAKLQDSGKFSEDFLDDILDCFEKNVPLDIIKKIAVPEFNTNCILGIRENFKNLSFEEMYKYYSPNWNNWLSYDYLLNAVAENKPQEFIQFLNNTDFTFYQTEDLKDMIKDKEIDLSDIKECMKNNFSSTSEMLQFLTSKRSAKRQKWNNDYGAAKKYIKSRLKEYYIPENNIDMSNPTKLINEILKDIQYNYSEMFDYIEYWGTGEAGADQLYDEGNEDAGDLLMHENFPEGLIQEHIDAYLEK